MGKSKLPTTEYQLELLKGQRRKGESDKSVQACNDFMRLGTGRTIPLLLQHYEFLQESAKPTDSIHTLYRWHNDYEWKLRAAEYDAEYEAIKNVERQAVMEYGVALEHERVRKLKRLADMLEAQIYERGANGELYNVWVSDVKQIGSGENTERVDIERFNGQLIEQYRSVLDDLAKETGGRKTKTEIGNMDNKELVIKVIHDSTSKSSSDDYA